MFNYIIVAQEASGRARTRPKGSMFQITPHHSPFLSLLGGLKSKRSETTANKQPRAQEKEQTNSTAPRCSSQMFLVLLGENLFFTDV